MWWLALFGCGDPCRDPGAACRVAGDGEHGFVEDGVRATEARLYYPIDLAVSPAGDAWFVVDWNNERVRRVGPDGRIETVIGADAPGDGDPAMGDRRDPGAPGERVALNHPVQVEFAPDGRMYLAAWHNHKVRRWDPETGLVRVVVANHDQTTGNNGGFTGDGGDAETAHVNFPSSLAFDAEGSMYLLDQKNVRVRRVTVDGVIDTIAGTGESGDADGPGLEATFRFAENPSSNQPPPGGAVEVDRDAGVLWIADSYNGRLRRMDLASGEVTSLEVEGMGVPNDVELGPDGRLYVADSAAHAVLAVDPETGEAERVVGTGEPGHGDDGLPATEYALNQPMGLDVSDDGAIWVSDTLNSAIVRVTP